MRRTPGRVLTIAYGICALAVFTLLFVLATVLALVVPRLEWRRRLTHRLARLALPVLGIRLVVDGVERLPDGSCVVVAAAAFLVRDQARGGGNACGRLPAETHRV